MTSQRLPRLSLCDRVVTADTEVKPPLESACRAIDAVHDTGPAGAATLEVFSVTGSEIEGAEAAYAYNKDTGRALGIYLSRESSRPALSLVHEIGHFLDHTALRDAPVTANAGYFTSAASALFARWRAAVRLTDAVQHLQTVIEHVSATVTLEDGGEVSVGIDHDYVNYLLDDKELFARSYTQYVVEHGGDGIMKAHLQNLRERPLAALYPLAWGPDDFAPVAAELDIVFQLKGWKE